MLELTELKPLHEHAYEDLLEACPWSMVYHSLGYRRFLNTYLPSAAEDHYLLAFEDGQLVGALPSFLMDGPLGSVLNSLPFFGSHGSILLRPGASPSVAAALVTAMMDLCSQRSVVFATVIDTPFSNNEEVYKRTMNFQCRDQRIGQFTPLPKRGCAGVVSESLLALFHQRRRNIVRKAVRSNLVFGHDESQQTLDALHSLHETNILGIGGIAKPKRFFDSIASQMHVDKDYRIYTARTEEGEIVCALMLLYFKDAVEYFVPATAESWRSAQPLSALIYLAMRDAVLERGARIWNWGGTWLTQDGVYHFKSRWGTRDYPYYYYTRVFLDMQSLRSVGRQALLKGYPWFYTVPFSALEQ
ncbi:GNAT family N-acetyltransferase [Alphaproteobacteria bacterium]|nr:GNAT family N-acetyltransferase [Alphaproteobacteria bacterium]